MFYSIRRFVWRWQGRQTTIQRLCHNVRIFLFVEPRHWFRKQMEIRRCYDDPNLNYMVERYRAPWHVEIVHSILDVIYQLFYKLPL